MQADAAVGGAVSLPDGYGLESHRTGPVTQVHALAPNEKLAASGCAAETVVVCCRWNLKSILELSVA
jgi:hypothetical protein